VIKALNWVNEIQTMYIDFLVQGRRYKLTDVHGKVVKDILT